MVVLFFCFIFFIADESIETHEHISDMQPVEHADKHCVRCDMNEYGVIER